MVERRPRPRRFVKVAGIDPSLNNTAVVVLDEFGALTSHRLIQPKNRRGAERLVYLRDEAYKCYRGTGVEAVVFIEGYAHGASKQAHQLGELGGVLRAAFYEGGIEYHVVPPSRMKKYITGSGAGGKIGVIKAVIKKWGHDFETDDVYDAFGLAQFGCGYLRALVGREAVFTNPQREALRAQLEAEKREVPEVLRKQKRGKG